MPDISREFIQDDQLLQLYFRIIDSSMQFVPLHWHNHLELLYIQEGMLDVYVNDDHCRLVPGDIYIINPREIHSTQMVGDTRYQLLQISETHLQRLGRDYRQIQFQTLFQEKDRAYKALRRCFENLGKIAPENADDKTDNSAKKESGENPVMEQTPDSTEGFQLLFLSEIYRLLYTLRVKTAVTLLPSENEKSRDFSRVAACMKYVESHYSEKLTLEDAASLLSLAPAYVSRLFKAYTGQSFYNYVIQIRLAHFYDELTSTDESIENLMDKNGFTSYKTLSKHFKEVYRKTPREIREP